MAANKREIPPSQPGVRAPGLMTPLTPEAAARKPPPAKPNVAAIRKASGTKRGK